MVVVGVEVLGRSQVGLGMLSGASLELLACSWEILGGTVREFWFALGTVLGLLGSVLGGLRFLLIKSWVVLGL